MGSLLGVLFIGVSYYIGDLKGDPNLENYPYNSTYVLHLPNLNVLSDSDEERSWHPYPGGRSLGVDFEVKIRAHAQMVHIKYQYANRPPKDHAYPKP